MGALPWVVQCCLFFRSRLLLYSVGFAVNRVQVVFVLSGFSVILFSFVQTKTLCRYVYMYFLAALVFVDVMLISSAYAMN